MTNAMAQTRFTATLSEQLACLPGDLQRVAQAYVPPMPQSEKLASLVKELLEAGAELSPQLEEKIEDVAPYCQDMIVDLRDYKLVFQGKIHNVGDHYRRIAKAMQVFQLRVPGLTVLLRPEFEYKVVDQREINLLRRRGKKRGYDAENLKYLDKKTTAFMLKEEHIMKWQKVRKMMPALESCLQVIECPAEPTQVLTMKLPSTYRKKPQSCWTRFTQSCYSIASLAAGWLSGKK